MAFLGGRVAGRRCGRPAT